MMNIRLFYLLTAIHQAETTKQQMDCRVALMEFDPRGLSECERLGLDSIKAVILTSGFVAAQNICKLVCEASKCELTKRVEGKNVKIQCDSRNLGNRYADKRTDDGQATGGGQ